jgi:spore coat polysaccharide biosynthesis predicted glycosyltransferase SpsG
LVYRCDATSRVGFGHLKRGLDLVLALRGRESVAASFLGNYDDRARACDMDTVPTDDAALQSWLERRKPTLAFVDLLDWDTDPDFMRIFRRTCRVTVAITDDSCKRAIDADLVVNCNPAQDPAWYVEAERYRLGLDYFVADPALAACRKMEVTSLQGRRAKILVVFGGHDLHDSKLKIARALEPLQARLHLDLLVTPVSPPTQALEQYLRASRWDAAFHRNVPSAALASLFADADMVVCSMGNIGYEALVVGCPIIAVNHVPRQNEIASCLAARGAVVNLGLVGQLDEERIRHEVARLLDSDAERRRLSESASAQCDGLGLGRIVEAVLELVKRKGMTQVSAH